MATQRRLIALVIAVPCVVCRLLSSPGLFAQKVSFRFDLVPPSVIAHRIQNLPLKDGAREAELKQLFVEAGCRQTEIDEETVRRKDPPNVICTLPGQTNSVIIVGAHFDHVASGKGAVDDWSGASMLPSLYQALDETSRKHTFKFVGFTDEEGGLIGSRFYVKQIPKDQLSEIKAMVNLECLGLGTTEVWVDAANKKLLAALIDLTQTMHVGLKGMNVEKVGNDDTQALRDKKIPVITIHSLTQQTLPILHSPRDTLAAVSLEHLYESYRIVAEYLAFLDGLLD